MTIYTPKGDGFKYVPDTTDYKSDYKTPELSDVLEHAEPFENPYTAPKTEGWKKEMSKRMKGKGNPMYGKRTSAKQKEAVSKANSVPKPWVAENMRKRHAEGEVYQWTSEDNPRKQRVSVEGNIYSTLKEASVALDMNYSKLRDRLNSKNFPDYYRC